MAAVAVVLGSTVPAHADRTYTVSLATADHGTGDGSARADVILDYKGKRTLYFSGELSDRGEKDGRGAYLITVLTFADGSKVTKHIGEDTSGAGDEAEHTYAPIKTGKRIRHLRVFLQERDSDASRPHDVAASSVKDNPFTH